MDSLYQESARSIPIARTVDVVVAGGGLAGVAAAVAAARLGANTLIVERNGIFGGVATAGLMTAMANFYFDRSGKQVIKGLSEEIARRVMDANGGIKHFALGIPKVTSDPEVECQILMDMLEEAGVEMLTHAIVSDAIMGDGVIRGLVVESKSGRQAILAQMTIDATGDADVAVRAGAEVVPFITRKDSLVFRVGNADFQRTYEYLREHQDEWPENSDIAIPFSEFERHWLENGIFHYPHYGGLPKDFYDRANAGGGLVRKYGAYIQLDAFCIDGLRWNGTGSIVTGALMDLDNTDQWAITKAEVEGRRACFEAHRMLKSYLPGFENSFVSHIARDLGVRLSRHIVGHALIDMHDARAGIRYDDAIGLAVHIPPTKNPAHGIPYGVLVPRGVRNLLNASGKSAAVAENKFVNTLRGQAKTMLLGQAAGTAAALCVRHECSPDNLDVALLQHTLVEHGVYLEEMLDAA